MTDVENRCRIILISPIGENAAAELSDALGGGDVASVIIAKGELNDSQYAAHAEELVPIIQNAGAAALLVDDTQTMGRTDADGMFIPSGIDRLIETMENYSPKRIVGYGGSKDRHNSMMAGDVGPDFMFFGRIDGDIKPEAHPKNIALAEWWSALIEIPCVVMAGSEIDSVISVAQSGADFVALNKAVFAHIEGPAQAVRQINGLLEQHAPKIVLED